MALVFLSTPSGWRATAEAAEKAAAQKISIHALRVEGDFLGAFAMQEAPMISIHALRVEGDAGDQQSCRA